MNSLNEPDHDQLVYRLALFYVPGVGPVQYRRILQHLSRRGLSCDHLFKGSRDDLSDLGFSKLFQEKLSTVPWDEIEKDCQWASQAGHGILYESHPNYPELLKQIHDPPPILFTKGNLSALTKPSFAIVGSRHPTQEGLSNAFHFAQSLSALGFSICSGLALGIDAACHQGALKRLGTGLGFLGTGIDIVYPKCHRFLFDALLEQGLLLSELPRQAPPRPKHFPKRNRLISGVSHGLLVVEAGLKSGSLITAYAAIEQNKDVFAIPGSIHKPQSQGCHRLIQEGGKLVQNIQDILTELPAYLLNSEGGSVAALQTETPRLVPNTQSLLDLIQNKPIAFETLMAQTQREPENLRSELLDLELKGFIIQEFGGYLRYREPKS